MRAGILAGTLLFLAFFAKQTALPVGLCIALATSLRSRAVGITSCIVLVVLTGAASLGYHLATDGWSTWYWYELLSGHRIHQPAVLGFWIEFAVALGVGGIASAIGLGLRGSGAARAVSTPTVVCALALIAAAWLGRAHEGGFDNTLIPAAMAVSLLAGPALARAVSLGGAAASLVQVLLIVQFALLAWDPRTALPSEHDRREGERVVAELAAVDGEVFVPYQTTLARRAGKAPSIHYMAIEDLLKSAESDPGSARHARGQRFVDRFVKAIEERRFGALVMSEDRADLAELLLRTYSPPRAFVDPTQPELFTPVTGFPARPNWIYLPRP